MKSLMIAGALLHTFSQAPQPYKANNDTKIVDFIIEPDTFYETEEAVNNKYIGNMGIYQIEAYYTEYKLNGEYNVLNYKLTTNIENYTSLPSNELNIYLNFDVIPEETGQGAVAFHYIQGNIIDAQQIRTATQSEEIAEIRQDFQEQPDVYVYNYNKTWIGSDRNDITNTINTVHQQEINISMWIDANIDIYRIALDNIQISYIVPVPTQEVIDVPGLFWTILGMPFAFISQAFNLTIFPGTPYSLNVSNLLFTVIGAMILIYIVRRFTR